jgi:hypothetical protein
VQLTTYDGEGSVALPVLLGAGGVVAEVVGLSMMKSTVRPQDLDLAMESIVVGETRMDAVIKCFGRPTTIATDGDTRTATFLARSLGRTYAVTITSRAGIVSGKRKAESGPY